MKFIYSLLFIIINLSFITAEEMEIYSNNELGLAIQYPVNWQINVKENQLSFTSQILFDDKKVQNNALAVFSITITSVEKLTDNSQNLDLDKLWKILAEDMAVKIDEPKKIKINNLKAIKGIIKYPKNENMAGNVYMIINQKKIYLIITGIKPLESANKYLKIFDDMVNSIQFLININ